MLTCMMGKLTLRGFQVLVLVDMLIVHCPTQARQGQAGYI